MRRLALLLVLAPTPGGPANAQSLRQSGYSTDEAKADLRLSIASGLAKVMDLSPDGTELWVRETVKWAETTRSERSDEIDAAIGRELARPIPDTNRLAALIAQFADDEAAAGRREKQHLVDLALRLSAADRQKVARFLLRQFDGAADNREPIVEIVP